MSTLIQAIEIWPLSVALRKSIWVYPLINTGHILGIAMLIGAIGTLDLRLLGFWRQHSVKVLAGVLVTVAASGLALAVAMGLLLFLARPGDYIAHLMFQVKLLLIVLNLFNIWLLHRHPDWRVVIDGGPITTRVRIAAIVSLVLWLLVLLLGRLLGYR